MDMGPADSAWKWKRLAIQYSKDCGSASFPGSAQHKLHAHGNEAQLCLLVEEGAKNSSPIRRILDTSPKAEVTSGGTEMRRRGSSNSALANRSGLRKAMAMRSSK